MAESTAKSANFGRDYMIMSNNIIYQYLFIYLFDYNNLSTFIIYQYDLECLEQENFRAVERGTEHGRLLPCVTHILVRVLHISRGRPFSLIRKGHQL